MVGKREAAAGQEPSLSGAGLRAPVQEKPGISSCGPASADVVFGVRMSAVARLREIEALKAIELVVARAGSTVRLRELHGP
jgi:hypothetical protein